MNVVQFVIPTENAEIHDCMDEGVSFQLECKLCLRLQAKLPLLGNCSCMALPPASMTVVLTPLTYIHVGKACTPAIGNLLKLFYARSLAIAETNLELSMRINICRNPSNMSCL